MENLYIVQHEYENNKGCEVVRLIGLYSTKEKAEKALESVRNQHGFRDYPSGFYLERIQLDEDSWREGFVRM